MSNKTRHGSQNDCIDAAEIIEGIIEKIVGGEFLCFLVLKAIYQNNHPSLVAISFYLLEIKW
jgi:hypothetical protein